MRVVWLFGSCAYRCRESGSGPLAGLMGFIRDYVRAGTQQLVLRVVGEHETVLAQLAKRRDELVSG